jgi:hypothetical protein
VAGMAKYALATTATFGKRSLLTDHQLIEFVDGGVNFMVNNVKLISLFQRC